MPKTKSSKRFSKHQASNIKQKKFVEKVKKSQKIKEQKLLEREFSDSDNEIDAREERHISLLNGTGDKNKIEKELGEKKHEVTAEEIADFWKKLESNQGKDVEDDDEEVNKLISNVQDDFDVIEADKSGSIKTSTLENEEDNEDDHNDDEEEDSDVIENDSDNISDSLEIKNDDSEHNEEDDDLEDELEDNNTDESEEAKQKRLERLTEKKFANLFGVHLNLKSQSSEYVKKVLISRELCQTWIEAVQEGKKNNLKQMLVAFYTASLQFGERNPEEETAFQLSPFRIDSPSVYMRVVLGALRFAPEAFWKIMNIPSTSTSMPNKALMRKKKVFALVSLYSKAALRIFSHTTKADALKYALQYLVNGLPFFSSNIIIAKSLIKIILKLLHHTDEIVRVRSFIVLHEIASKFQKPVPDLVLKGIYYSYFEFATECTPDNIKRLEFYRNCITELYGVNFDLSYKHAYSYIRGLAETFQTASKENLVQKRKSLINWRFVNCLECWAHVLSTYHAKDELGDLIFPFTQLLIGVAVLFKENAAWTPLRLKLAGQLNRLSAASGHFIPSSTILLSMLRERQLIEEKKQSSITTIDFEFKIRVPEKIVKTIEFQRAALHEWIYLVAGFLVMHAKSVSFPEISHPVLRAIIAFRHEYFGRNIFGTSEKRIRAMNDSRFLDTLRRLQKAIEDQSNTILQKRSRIPFSPQEIIQDPTKIVGLVFEDNQVTAFEKYYETLKKEHDADVLRRMMRYHEKIHGVEKKDEIDSEIDKTIKDVKKSEVKAKVGEKRKRSDEDKPVKRIKTSNDTEETKSLKITSFFD